MESDYHLVTGDTGLYLKIHMCNNISDWERTPAYSLASSHPLRHRGWRTKCHSIDCTYNTFLLLQKHLTSGTELILLGWKIVSNECPQTVRFQGAHLVPKCARKPL